MTELLKSRVRKPLASLLALAMVFSIVVIPAGAFGVATPAGGPTITSGGTNLDSFGANQTAANGYNGTHSIEVTGQVATQSVLKGTTTANTVTLNDINVTHTDDFVIEYPAGVETTITGLTLSSTVADVMSKITSQITSLTAGRDTATRLVLTAVPYGAKDIFAVDKTDDGKGVAAKVFGPAGDVNAPARGYGYRFDIGVDYGPNFRVIDTFTDAVSGAQMVLADPAAGYTDPFAGFKLGKDPVSGLYSAIQLAPGYDLDITTTGGKGVAVGKATVVVSGGQRTAVAPTFAVAPVTVQAGKVFETTATITAGANGALDGATFTLPAGFTATGTPVAYMDSKATSVTVSSGVYTVTPGAGKLVASSKIEVGFKAVASTTAGSYKLTGTYKNFGGAATPAIESNTGIVVTAEDKAKTVKFLDNPLYARAGQTAIVGAQLLDQYGNELSQPRVVKYSLTSTVTAAQSGVIGSRVPVYGYQSNIMTGKTAGLTAVKYSVYYNETTTTVETSGTVNIDTVGVGAPAKLQVVSTENPADAGASVYFRIQLVDAAGKTSAFLAGEAENPTAVSLNYGPNANAYYSASVDIPVKISETLQALTSDAADTSWEMWAFDKVGRVAKSATLVQTWIPAETEAAYKLTVTASPALVSDARYGYAAADGSSTVTFSVKAAAGHTVKAEADSSLVGNAAKPGVLVNTTAVADANGVATFKVVSNTPNASIDYKKWVFTDLDAQAAQGAGWSYFYAPQVKAVSVDKLVAYNDGVDAAKFSFTVKSPLDGAVVAGTRVYFKATDSDSVLSTTSAVTDANGVATVSLTSKTAGYSKIGVIARDFSGVSSLNSLDKGVGVYFTEYKAFVKDGAALTAQQSERDPEVSFKIVLKDAAGNLVSFNKVTDIDSETSHVWADQSDNIGGVDVEIDYYENEDGEFVPAIGDNVKFVLSGSANVEGVFSSVAEKVFMGEFSVAIVNKAAAAGRGSVVLDAANVSGTGFKPGEMAVYATKVAGGKKYYLGEIYANEDGVAKPQRVSLTDFAVGSYDLYVDGIKFAGALKVVPGFDIGLTKTLLRIWSSPSKPVAGKKAVFYGQVSGLYMDGEAHGALARPVYLRYKAAKGGWKTVAVRVASDTGYYSFSTIAKRGQYCVWSPGDGKFLANSSLAYGAKPITVK